MKRITAKVLVLILSFTMLATFLSGCGLFTHEHQWGEWQTTELSTCTEEGVEIRICLDNEDHIDTRKTEKEAHKPGPWVTAVKPTCTTTGIRERYCTVCGLVAQTDSVAILPSAHDWGMWMPFGENASTCFEEGEEVRICLNSASHKEERFNEKPDHKWGKGVLDAPDCTTMGSLTYTCLVDGTHTKTESVSELGHDYQWVFSDTEEVGTCQREGCGHIETSAIIAPESFVKIAAGASHNLMIDNNGNLWAFGTNQQGQIGNGTSSQDSDNNQLLPLRVNAQGRMNNIKVVDIAAGRLHSLALDINGNVWSWGQSNAGQVGNGQLGNFYLPQQINRDGKINNLKIKKISAGYEYSLVIDENDELWAWGNNFAGQLGDDTRISSYVPIKVKTNLKFKEIMAGHDHSMAVDFDGNLWTWGSNAYGQIGDGTSGVHYLDRSEDRLVPTLISREGLFNNKKIEQISAGMNLSLAIDEDGNLWSWGNNANGYMGIDSNIDKAALPNQINTNGRMNNKKAAKIATGSYSSYATDQDGNLWGWGWNPAGELGDGTKITKTKPVLIKIDAKESNIVMFDIGSQHSIVIDKEGWVWTVGYNSQGQLGIGSVVQQTLYIKIRID